MGHHDAQEIFQAGRLRARIAQSQADIHAAQRLRYRAFIDPSSAGDMRDCDRFDSDWQHLLIEDGFTGDLLAAARLKVYCSRAEVMEGYSAQFYDLARFATEDLRALEVGRFCTAPGVHGPGVTRLAWAYFNEVCEAWNLSCFIGCSSFKGADPALHQEALMLLGRAHQAPEGGGVAPKAPETYRYVEQLAGGLEARGAALRQIPPLLRSYLRMGAWVSDHAVLDRTLNTLHVFTCLPHDNMGQARVQNLRLHAVTGCLLREGA